MTDRRSPTRILSRWFPFAVAAITLTCAGLVWLKQSSALTAAGRRIYVLELRRQDLLEQRAELLAAHAVATDPRRLDERASQLGFGPTDRVEYLPVEQPFDLSGPGLRIPPGSSLALTWSALPSEPVEETGLPALWLNWTARPAVARQADEPAVGGASP